MANFTAAEAKARDIAVMGEDLGALYHALWQVLASLNAMWSEYVDLYGTKPTRLDLLNRVAPHFFRIVGDSLWREALLQISRLTDPPVTPRGKGTEPAKNLSITRIPPLIENADLKGVITELVKVALEKSEFCRDWRNRHLAHNDLGIALNDERAEPLRPASRAAVREALKAIADVLNAVSGHYHDSTTNFDDPVFSGGAIGLLYTLRDGLRFDAERAERMKRGEYGDDDDSDL